MRSRITEETQTGRLAWAAALILGGIVLLLFNAGLFAAYEPLVQYILAGLLVLGSAIFFASYFTQRTHWWRLIPAWTLLALAGMAYLSTLEQLDQRLMAALLFLGQALAFVHLYLLDRSERWWAVMPGGFMLVLGGVIALSSRTEDLDVLGAVLFAGLGLVFLLLYLLGVRRRLWWALIPGGVLILFGVFIVSAGADTRQYLGWWPLLLILLGIWLGWRARRPPQRQRLAVHSAPNLSHRSTARRTGREPPPRAVRGQLGEYAGPAPGASVEVLADPDEQQDQKDSRHR